MERGEVHGPLRLPVVDREGLAPALDARQELQPADAVLARQARRPAGRAAGDGPRAQRRGAADPAADLRPAGDGTSLCGAGRACPRTAPTRCARRSWPRWPTRISSPTSPRRSSRSPPVSGEKLENDGARHLSVDAARGRGEGDGDGEIAGATRGSCKQDAAHAGPQRHHDDRIATRADRNAARRRCGWCRISRACRAAA